MALRILAWSTFIWVAFLALEAVLPIRSAQDGRLEVLVLVVSYVGVMSATAVVVASTIGWGGTARNTGLLGLLSADNTTSVQLNRLIQWTLVVSLLGLFLVFFDKAFIQGIDFSQGPSVARTMWKQRAAERQGVSSIFSVIGNVASVGYFISLVLLQLHWERLARWRLSRWIYLGTGILCLFLYSYLSGGRTPVLTAMVAVLAVGMIRKEYGQPAIPGGLTFGFLVSLLGGTAAVAFALYIFARRAGMNEIPLGQYAGHWISELGGERTPVYFQIEEMLDVLEELYHLSMTMGAYLVHSLWIFDGITNLAHRDGQSVFVAWIGHVNKVPLVDISRESYYYAGYFPTLPGALYYQFGGVGMVVGALVHGGAVGVTSVIVKYRQGGILALGFVVLVLISTFLAPIGVAFDFMVVPMLFLFGSAMAGGAVLLGHRRNLLGE